MKFFLIMSLLMSGFSYASFLIPSDYDELGKFVKVEQFEGPRGMNFRFEECEGTMQEHKCVGIFHQSGYSQTELQLKRSREKRLGFGILAAEVVTGGFIWKRLMKFTLGGTTRLVRRQTGWSEGVANGSVALVITAPTTATASYVMVSKAEDLLNTVDSWERYKRTQLLSFANDDKKLVFNSRYDYFELYKNLDSLLN